MKKLSGLLFGLLVVLSMLCALAEDAPVEFDVEQYSLDELRQIKTLVDERLAFLEREWAIEHGDRTISFEEEDITLFIRKNLKLHPVITRVVDDAPEKTSLLWSSSDDSIAKVSSEGTVTGVAKGDATITATAKDNDCIFGSIPVHIVLPVSKVTIEETDVTLLLNDRPEDAEANLHISIDPEDAHVPDVEWSSSKEDIVTVDEDGHIQGLKPGKSTITAKSKEEGSDKKAVIGVTVVQAVRNISLSESELIIDKGKTAKLGKEILPEDATTRKVEWSSSNETIAKVSQEGTITARSCGECDITCTAKDGSQVSAKCHVIVKQLVTSIKLSESKITLPRGKTQIITATVLPEDATSKKTVWSSSDMSIAYVINGRIVAKNGGDCEITCATTDGSEKKATIKVHVPTFSVSQTEYTVTSKGGLTIPVNINGNHSVTANSSASCFDYKMSENLLYIKPKKAGSGTIKLINNDAKEDTVTLKITIEHSAVYDSTSYPKASYENVLRHPEKYKGNNLSIYGKVIQKSEGWGTVILRVGTGGYGYYDKVFWIEYSTSSVSASVIEDDYITVYGECTGTHTYETVLGSSVTIPAIKAEKIVIGRK